MSTQSLLVVPDAHLQRERPTTLPMPTTEAGAILAIIERASRDPSVDLDKMDRLMKMHDAASQKVNEAAFDEAMKNAQAEMRPVAADAENDQTHSKYASYAALDRAIRPIYTRHGFAISFDEADTPKPDHIRVLAYVTCAGFKRTYRKDIAADGKGAKGGAVMTPTHASGAASSYGMRYLLKMIFNIAVGEDDTDGNPAGPTVDLISDEQVAKLDALITDVGASKASFLSWMNLPRLADIPAAKFDHAWRAVESKRKKPAAPQGSAKK
jgi:hypothetical protein